MEYGHESFGILVPFFLVYSSGFGLISRQNKLPLFRVPEFPLEDDAMIDSACVLQASVLHAYLQYSTFHFTL